MSCGEQPEGKADLKYLHRRGRTAGSWPLRQRLELVAFDARLAGVPPALLEALWEVLDRLSGQSEPW